MRNNGEFVACFSEFAFDQQNEMKVVIAFGFIKNSAKNVYFQAIFSAGYSNTLSLIIH